MNVARASDKAVRIAAKLVADEETVENLLEQRKTTGRMRVKSQQSQSNDLHRLLTDKSQCYSLWIAMTSDHRERHALFIENTASNRTQAFLW